MLLQNQGKAESSPNPPPLPHCKQASGGKQGWHRTGSRALVKRVQAGDMGEERDSSEIHVFKTISFCGKQNAEFSLTAKMPEFPQMPPN